mgnify:CR=1 FL=1
MEFTLDKQTITDPKKRFFFGVVAVIVGIVFIFVSDFYSGVSRENCLQVEATFDQCKSRSSQSSQGGFTYYLTFEDHVGDHGLGGAFAVVDEADLFAAADLADGGFVARQDQFAGNAGAGSCEYLADRAFFGDMALIDDGHTVADLIDHAHLMGDDHDGHAHFFVDLL